MTAIGPELVSGRLVRGAPIVVIGTRVYQDARRVARLRSARPFYRRRRPRSMRGK